MKRMIIFITFVLAVLNVQAITAEESFTWHLALVRNEEGLPIDSTIPMNNDDTFSIEIYTEKDCYMYLVVEMSSGSISPYHRQIKAKVPEKIVQGTIRPPKGQEKFYVGASLNEQKTLQNAIENYNKEKTPNNALVVKTLLFEAGTSYNKSPGQPVDFAGTIRGESILGTEYSGASVYSKTITISH